jgi:hypothetical protein
VAASFYEYMSLNQWRFPIKLVSGSIRGGFLLELTRSVANSCLAYDSISGGYTLSIAATVQSVAALYLYLPFALIYLQKDFASWNLVPLSEIDYLHLRYGYLANQARVINKQNFLGLHFNPEDRGNTLFRNVGELLPDQKKMQTVYMLSKMILSGGTSVILSGFLLSPCVVPNYSEMAVALDRNSEPCPVLMQDRSVCLLLIISSQPFVLYG